MKYLAAILLTVPLLTACDAIKDRMGIPIPEKLEAEGKAIGSACRHAGRGLEDCFRLNSKADKAAVHTGWKEMNEYMLKNNMQAIPPEFPASLPGKVAKHGAEDVPEATGSEVKGKAATPAEKGTDKTQSDAEDKDAATKEKADKKPAAKDSHGDKPSH